MGPGYLGTSDCQRNGQEKSNRGRCPKTIGPLLGHAQGRKVVARRILKSQSDHRVSRPNTSERMMLS